MNFSFDWSNAKYAASGGVSLTVKNLPRFAFSVRGDVFDYIALDFALLGFALDLNFGRNC